MHIISVADWNHFVGAEPGKAKLALLAAKPEIPPKVKILSMKFFEEPLCIAFVSKKLVPDLFGTNSILVGTGQVFPSSLPVFYNLQLKEFVGKLSGEHLHRYLADVVKQFRKHQFENQPQIEELTLEMYENANVCSTLDYKFCLLVIFPTMVELNAEKERRTLWNVAEEFRKEKADPLRVHYVVLDAASGVQAELRAKLNNLLEPVGYIQTGSIEVLLWRPKWRRFDRFKGDIANSEELISFIRSTFMQIALDGPAGFTRSHEEL